MIKFNLDTPEKVAQFASDYARIGSIKLAKKLGVNTWTIRRWCRQLGVPVIKPGRPSRKQ